MNGAPNPQETNSLKKAGIAQIALQVVVGMKTPGDSIQGQRLHEKCVSIIDELVSQWPAGQDHSDILSPR